MFLIRKDTLFFVGTNKTLAQKLTAGLLKTNTYRWTSNEKYARRYEDFFDADKQASIFRTLGMSVTVETRIGEEAD